MVSLKQPRKCPWCGKRTAIRHSDDPLGQNKWECSDYPSCGYAISQQVYDCYQALIEFRGGGWYGGNTGAPIPNMRMLDNLAFAMFDSPEEVGAAFKKLLDRWSAEYYV